MISGFDLIGNILLNVANEAKTTSSEQTTLRGIVPGDVIAVKRFGGLYEHFAVYIGNNRVIHFAADNGDFGRQYVHEAPFEDFLRYDRHFEVLDFAERRENPIHRPGVAAACCLTALSPLLLIPVEIYRNKNYHLYSNTETVRRAKRIAECVKRGEKSCEFDGKHYSLLGNNCENFAIWCKTGISESRQVDALIRGISVPHYPSSLPLIAAANIHRL